MRAASSVAALALLGSALWPGVATADGHKLLVLQSEGRADAGLRARINVALLRLATAADLPASAGQLTFSDAATAVGCKPDAPGCKDEVLGMLSVDEIVVTTVNPRAGGVEISVRRIGKGGASREAQMVLAAGAPADKLDGLAPLFSDRPVVPASSAPGSAATAPALAPAAEPPAGAAAAPAPGSDAAAGHTAAAPIDQPRPSASITDRRLELTGIVGGATLVTAGLICWAAASGVQGDIDGAPTRTGRDLTHLRDLEARGDRYATAGNVLVLGGIVVAGVATYFYVRDRPAASSSSARLMPTVFDHGAGVVLTLEGRP